MDEYKEKLREIKQMRRETHRIILNQLLKEDCIDPVDMLDIAIWKLACDTFGKTNDRDERRRLVMEDIEQCLTNWI